MLLNYIQVALRNLFKHKLYSMINVGGLSIGLTVVILIGLFVRYETSYDKFWENGDKVYRAEVTFNVPGRPAFELAETPAVLLPTLQREFAGSIAKSARIMRNCYEIRHAENAFNECADFVDPEFFGLFNFEVVAGNEDLALANNSSIMIAESIALKYFGNKDVLGQTLLMGGDPYTVVAIMKNLPPNSHINSDMIGLFDENKFSGGDGLVKNWTNTNAHTYFILNEGTVIEDLVAAMPEFLEKNVTFSIPGLENMSPSELMEISFTKVTDIHLQSTRQGNMTPPGDVLQVLTFSGVALMVLLIATINFMNLSSARATQRAREVAMRKVMGATRKQLMIQFLGEALIMTTLGLLLAIAFVEMLLPLYSSMLNKPLSFDVLTDVPLLLSMIGLVFVIGILGGYYPALVLSNFKPATVLHSSTAGQSGSLVFRNILVLAQFTITIGLMIVTGVIYGQTLYAANTDLGYSSEDRVILRGLGGNALYERLNSVTQELQRVPGVESVTFSSDSMPLNNNNNTLIEAPGGALGGNILVSQLRVGFNFFEYYDITPLAGRTFSRDFAGDEFFEPVVENDEVLSFNTIINEKTANQLGFASPQDALNKQVKILVGVGDVNSAALATIVGVIPNVVFYSVREDVTPMIFIANPKTLRSVHVKMSKGHSPAMVEALGEVWKNVSGSDTTGLRYVNDNIEALYQQERMQATMFVFFAGFAIFVACLGLFGMASFTAERRTKEIGIRKVLGARVFDIIKLLVMQASKPVLWANVIAWPIAGYFVYDWLQGFTLRMGLGYLSVVFIAAACLAIIIAWLTVGLHAYRVAKANPIGALRSE